MPTREELIWITIGMVLAGVVMAMLHEKHYNGWRERIDGARALGLVGGLEIRLRTVEEILLEDRET